MKPERTLWLENLFRPLMIGVMFGCVALSLVELIRLAFPEWSGTFLVVGCVLAALEANYSYRLIRTKSRLSQDRLRFRVIEIAMIFILLKIMSYVGDNWVDILADIQTWPRQPHHVLDPETLAAFVLAILSWSASTQTVREFERLNEPPEYSRYYVSPLESMTRRFFRGGVVLLIAAGITRIGIAYLLKLRRPSVPGLVLNVLVYFLLGLVMLGQVRFATLNKRWQAQQIRVADNLASRWARYSLAFIGLAALLAFLLPTGYTLGLLELIGWIIGIGISVVTFITMLIYVLLTLPLAWLLSLFGAETPSPPSSSPPPQFQQPQPSGGGTPDWFLILKSLVFWVIALGMVLYVVRNYLRDHPDLLASLARMAPIRFLGRLWSALRRWWGGWGEALQGRLARNWSLRWTRRARQHGEPFRFFRLGALSPRGRVIYYYLSALHRAGQQGVPRRKAQTPYEYNSTLEPHLPQAEPELERLTQAFVEARYSQHVIQTDDARHVRASWQRVKEALRALRPRTEEDSKR
jgi:hypothetical protein